MATERDKWIVEKFLEYAEDGFPITDQLIDEVIEEECPYPIPDWDVKSASMDALRENMETLHECKRLVDGAFGVIETWDAKTPAQQIWKRDWLIRAERIVPQESVT